MAVAAASFSCRVTEARGHDGEPCGTRRLQDESPGHLFHQALAGQQRLPRGGPGIGEEKGLFFEAALKFIAAQPDSVVWLGVLFCFWPRALDFTQVFCSVLARPEGNTPFASRPISDDDNDSGNDRYRLFVWCGLVRLRSLSAAAVREVLVGFLVDLI